MTEQVIPITRRPIIKTANPKFPQFLFEWHHNDAQTDGKVYIIGLPGRFVDGQWVPSLENRRAEAMVLAEHCDSHARFLGFVQTALRLYQQGMQDQRAISAGEKEFRLGYPGGGPTVEKIEHTKGQYDG